MADLVNAKDHEKLIEEHRSWINRKMIDSGKVLTNSFVYNLDEIPEFDYSSVNLNDYNARSLDKRYSGQEGKYEKMKDIIKRGSVKRCTILIPTYNRPNYLRRLLSYYNKFGENYNMIIADSSSNENKKINKNIISKFSKLNIFYIDKYSLTVKGHQKFLDAINQVKTKYSVFCADDDFITPNGINQSVDFLEKNPDFSCAHGHYISFYFETNKTGGKEIYWRPIYPFKSISFANAKERLSFHFSSYYPTIYAVHRTDLLKLIFKDAVEFTDDYRFGELLPSMLDSVYGKMIKIDVLYSARERIVGSAGQTNKNLNDFIKNGTYEKKYNKFKSCLVKHLIKNSQMNSDEAKELTDKAMSVYLKKSYSKDFKGILIGKMSNLLNALDLPESLDKNIRTLYRKMFTPRYNLNKSKEIDDFRKKVESPNSKHFDDFEKIRSQVLLYAENDN